MVDYNFFATLDAARQRRGDSIEAACASIGISRPTWYNWARGKGARWCQLKSAEAYIAAASRRAPRLK